MSTQARRFSVSLQLSASIAAMVLVIVGLLLTYLSQRMVSQLAAALEGKGASLGRVVASEVAAGLEFEDKGSVTNTLHGAGSDPDVLYGAVYEADPKKPEGKLLADYPEGKVPAGLTLDGRAAPTGEPAIENIGSVVKVTTNVASAGGAKGTLVLVLSADSVASERRKVVGASLMAGLIALLAGCGIALVLGRSVGRRVKALADLAQQVANGNLPSSVAASAVPAGLAADEVTDLASSFAEMAGSLREMLGDLQMSSSEVEREAGMLLNTVTQQSEVTAVQAATLNETSATIAEIAQTSKQATDYANSVIRLAQKSEDLSKQGRIEVETTVAAMEKLGEQVRNIARTISGLSESSEQIGEIMSTVKDLAERSNMLALNASIEAAKAGSGSRGFAVVAREMRVLAEQSKDATNQVREILGRIQKATQASVVATDEGSKRAEAAMSTVRNAGDSILGLSEVIEESSQAARQIAQNTKQQTLGVEQIVVALGELSKAMDSTVSGMQGVESVAGTLTSVSKQLSELVSRYRM